MHIYTRIRSIYIPAHFFLSHLHGVRVTSEQVRKPRGRIRKWSICELQQSRSRAAYSGIWTINRWITQSSVFPAQIGRHRAVVSVCACAREMGFILPQSITQSSKIFAMPGGILKNIWKKFDTALTFCWAFVKTFILQPIWLRVRVCVTVLCSQCQIMLIYSALTFT